MSLDREDFVKAMQKGKGKVTQQKEDTRTNKESRKSASQKSAAGGKGPKSYNESLPSRRRLILGTGRKQVDGKWA